MLALADDAYTRAVQGFFAGLPRPKAIVVVSSLGVSAPGEVEISAGSSIAVGHEFAGFPSELYQLDYPAAGDPGLAARVATLAAEAGLQPQLTTQRRLDYTAWMPLRTAFPRADIPVVQVSVPFGNGPGEALKLGHALKPLRGEDVLIVGAGSVVFNLERVVWYLKESAGESWAVEFERWVKQRLAEKNVMDLVSFEEAGPDAASAQPDPRHFYPLLVVVGSAWEGESAVPFFEGIQYRAVSMFSFALTKRLQH